MNYAPPAINLSETHGQSKFELFPLAVRVDARAPPCRRSEGYIFTSSDLHVVNVKAPGFSDHDKNVSQVAM